MSTQPEALRLAAHAEANASFGDMALIAAELRRLHEVNEELLEALKDLREAIKSRGVISTVKALSKTDAAIAKAEGGAA
jgi:hypothetical protein